MCRLRTKLEQQQLDHEERLQSEVHSYKKDLKDTKYHLQEANIRIEDLQEQVYGMGSIIILHAL